MTVRGVSVLDTPARPVSLALFLLRSWARFQSALEFPGFVNVSLSPKPDGSLTHRDRLRSRNAAGFDPRVKRLA